MKELNKNTSKCLQRFMLSFELFTMTNITSLPYDNINKIDDNFV